MKKCVLNLVNNTVYSIKWIIGTDVAVKAASHQVIGLAVASGSFSASVPRMMKPA